MKFLLPVSLASFDKQRAFIDDNVYSVQIAMAVLKDREGKLKIQLPKALPADELAGLNQRKDVRLISPESVFATTDPTSSFAYANVVLPYTHAGDAQSLVGACDATVAYSADMKPHTFLYLVEIADSLLINNTLYLVFPTLNAAIKTNANLPAYSVVDKQFTNNYDLMDLEVAVTLNSLTSLHFTPNVAVDKQTNSRYRENTDDALFTDIGYKYEMAALYGLQADIRSIYNIAILGKSIIQELQRKTTG